MSVFIPSDKMVAVGPGAADFVTEISIIVQKNAPLNVEKWKDVSDYAKDKIVEKVMVKFVCILFCLFSVFHVHIIIIMTLF